MSNEKSTNLDDLPDVEEIENESDEYVDQKFEVNKMKVSKNQSYLYWYILIAFIVFLFTTTSFSNFVSNFDVLNSVPYGKNIILASAAVAIMYFLQNYVL